MGENDSTKNRLNCLRCKNPVTTGIKCIQCGRLSHKCCLNILKIEILSDDTTICCKKDPSIEKLAKNSKKDKESKNDKEVDSDKSTKLSSIQSEESRDTLKISYLERIVRDKDQIIENQKLAIKALTDHLELLKTMNTNNIPVSTPKQNAILEKHTPSEQISKPNENKNGPSEFKVYGINQSAGTSQQNNSKQIITETALANALHHTEAQNVCNNVIGLGKNFQQRDIRPEYKSRSLLVGTQQSQNCHGLIAASFDRNEYLYHYHATNFGVDATQDGLEDYLKTYAPNVKVLKLNARYPKRYSSFKISLPSSESSTLLDPNIWPSHVILNRFFPSKRLPNQNY